MVGVRLPGFDDAEPHAEQLPPAEVGTLQEIDLARGLVPRKACRLLSSLPAAGLALSEIIRMRPRPRAF